MIVDELIYFDQEKLRHATSLEGKAALIKAYFAGFPPTSAEKLELFISLLNEREEEEKPYTYPVFNTLLTIYLIASIVALGLSFFSNSGITNLRSGIFIQTILLFLASVILNRSIYNAKKKRKYKRLIQVLEQYHLEINTMIAPS